MTGQTRAQAVLISGLILLCACSPSAPPSPSPIPPSALPPLQATATPSPKPSVTPSPTIAPSETPLPTETPIGQLFRDDFSGELQQGWVWQDEVPDRWTITQEGWLQILAEDPSLLKEGRQSNFLWRDAPVGDFVVTVHLASEVTSNFQQATLYLFKDADNYVAINRGFCSFCGGPGVYMEYRISGSSGSYNFLVAQPDLYLRLTSIGQTITGYYSLNSEDWVRAGRIGNYLPSAVIGLGATNAEPGEVNEDLVARFDYILVTLPD